MSSGARKMLVAVVATQGPLSEDGVVLVLEEVFGSVVSVGSALVVITTGSSNCTAVAGGGSALVVWARTDVDGVGVGVGVGGGAATTGILGAGEEAAKLVPVLLPVSVPGASWVWASTSANSGNVLGWSVP